MDRKRLILIFVALLSCCLILWRSANSPRAVIRFVGYKSKANGKVAVFRMENRSGDPYLFPGWSASEPDYLHAEPSGWKCFHNKALAGRSGETMQILPLMVPWNSQ